MSTCWGATSAVLLLSQGTGECHNHCSGDTNQVPEQTEVNGHKAPHGRGYLRIVGLHQLALSQEEFKVPPVHVGQQHHGLLSLLYTDMSDRQQIPGRQRNS